MNDETRPDDEPSEIPADVPEGDAIEQLLPALADDEPDEPSSLPPDADEADALDQARPVPADEDGDPRG
jgi:hypothetical protein